ncbi:MAG: hypothetical protein V4722_04580 [Bacteroidota bacterium]
MTKPALMLALLAVVACGSKYRLWDIDKFKIDAGALAPLEEIKLLYSSRAPDMAADRNYYLHVVVVSQKTGDTVNILTTSDNGFVATDGDKVFNFIPEINPSKEIHKVARDPEFDGIADNHFPTVIGTIGQVFKSPPQ